MEIGFSCIETARNSIPLGWHIALSEALWLPELGKENTEPLQVCPASLPSLPLFPLDGLEAASSS